MIFHKWILLVIDLMTIMIYNKQRSIDRKDSKTMKKTYETPKVEIIEFDLEIVASSSGMSNSDLFDCFSTDF